MKIVTAAIITRRGKYLVAKRKAGGVVGGKWEFPGGKLEENETPKQSLKRELGEELDIKAQIGKVFDEHIHCYKDGKMKIYAYAVSRYTGRIKLIDHDEMRWVAVNELKEMNFIGNDKSIIKKLTQGAQI